MRKRKNMNQYIPIYIMALPGILYLFINNYIPLVGLLIAFKDVDFSIGIIKSKFVGFQNFEYLFRTKDAWIITRNTLLYNIAFIILGTVLAVTIAIILSEIRNKKLNKIYQTSILLPHLVSMVIVSYLVYAFLSGESGFINKSILKPLGYEGISWYAKTDAWPFIIILVYLWKNAGYFCIVYLAAVLGIDQEIYEAASLDGTNTLQKIRYIMLPMIKPTIIMMVMLSIGRIFYSDFGLFYQVTQNSGMIYNATNVIDTYVYRALIQMGDISMSSAAGLYQSVVGFTLVLLSNKLVNKLDKESALF